MDIRQLLLTATIRANEKGELGEMGQILETESHLEFRYQGAVMTSERTFHDERDYEGLLRLILWTTLEAGCKDFAGFLANKEIHEVERIG